MNAHTDIITDMFEAQKAAYAKAKPGYLFSKPNPVLDGRELNPKSLSDLRSMVIALIDGRDLYMPHRSGTYKLTAKPEDIDTLKASLDGLRAGFRITAKGGHEGRYGKHIERYTTLYAANSSLNWHCGWRVNLKMELKPAKPLLRVG